MIIDAFLFSGLCGEAELVDLRLHELDGVVDEFVVVEAKQTFQGEPKPLRFPDVMSRIDSRIRGHFDYHAIDLPSANVHPRAVGGRERFARDMLGVLIPPGDPMDIVMISDCDEIPAAGLVEHVSRIGWAIPIQFGQIPFYMWMNLRITSDISEAPGGRKLWNGTLLTRRATLNETTAFQLRDTPGRKLIPHGGWHFSSLGGSEEMQRKLAAWGHPEKNQPPYNDLAHLERCFREGKDWDSDRVPPMELEWMEIDESYPQYVQEHPERFAAYLGAVPQVVNA